MPAPYSLDLRKRILQDCDGGMSSEDVARKYTVAIATVYSWRKQRRETGSIAPQEHRGGPKLKLAPYEKEVRQAVADHPDVTLVELAEILSQYVPVSDSTVCDFLKHLKITWKKRRFAPSNNTGRTSSSSERTGKCSKRCSNGSISFSSTKRGVKRIGHRFMAGRKLANG